MDEPNSFTSLPSLTNSTPELDKAQTLFKTLQQKFKEHTVEVHLPKVAQPSIFASLYNQRVSLFRLGSSVIRKFKVDNYMVSTNVQLNTSTGDESPVTDEEIDTWVADVPSVKQVSKPKPKIPPPKPPKEEDEEIEIERLGDEVQALPFDAEPGEDTDSSSFILTDDEDFESDIEPLFVPSCPSLPSMKTSMQRSVVRVQMDEGIQNDSTVVFMRGDPVLSDIHQNRSLHTCYILSSAAAYLASDAGRELLRSCFHIHKDRVNVELYLPLIESSLSIELPVKKDEARYSYSKNGSLWPALLEQAIQGVGLAVEKLAAEVSSNESKEVRYALNDNYLREYINHEGKANLDWGVLNSVFNHLPTPGNETGLYRAKQTGYYSFSQASKDDSERVLRKALQQSIPTVLGTKPASVESGLRALEVGVPTSHAVAVLREAIATDRHSNTIEGFLVFDPYGEDPGGMRDLDLLIGPSRTNIKLDKIKSVSFIPWLELTDHFAAMATSWQPE